MKLLLVIFILLNSFPCFTLAMAQKVDNKLITPKPGTVALTFDDGPNPNSTPKILEILRKYHVHATFFIIGKYAKKYPNLVKEIAKDGNVVASHSMTHPSFIGLSQDKLQYEVVTSKALLQRLTGVPVKCIRPPFNGSNDKIDEYINEQGMAVAPPGLNSFDYEQPGAERIAQCIVYYVRSGYIISLHDGPMEQNRNQMVKALPKIIEGIKKKGLGFSTICN